MSSILCGTDFSPQAREAMRVAAAWAARIRHRLQLVHVWDAWVTDEALVSAQAQACDRLRGTLEREADVLRAEFGATIETSVLTGSVHEVILREATANNARLVVVASLGRGLRHGWLLGSNAERIAQRSTVPVLVVRDAASLLAWIADAQELKVSVSVDLTEASRSALRWARDLAQLGRCSLELTHVAWPPAEPRFEAYRGEIAQAGDWSGVEAALAADVALWAGAEQHSTCPESARAVVNWGRPDAALVELAAAARIALIVAGSHRRSHVARLWQGSVTRGLLHHAATNVACVPPATNVAAELPARAGIA